MKSLLCSIYDTAVAAYMRPFTVQSEGQAIRMFIDEVQNRESPMHRHAHDYSLFLIGEFTDHNGEVKAIKERCLMKGTEASTHGVNINA